MKYYELARQIKMYTLNIHLRLRSISFLKENRKTINFYFIRLKILKKLKIQ